MIFGFLPIAALLGTAFIIPLISRKDEKYTMHFTFIGLLISLFFIMLDIPDVFTYGRIVYQMEGWTAPYGISLVVDPLSIILSMLFVSIGLLVVSFSHRYIKERRTKYFSLISLALAGSLGVINTGDLFNMFVYLEIMSVATYALVAFHRKRESLEAAIKYLIMGSLGTSLVLISIAFIYGVTGTLNMSDASLKITYVAGPIPAIALGLMMAGLAIKAGIMPFHTWLIDAHPAAPSPISALLSGLMIKLGIYAILRVGMIVFNAPQAFFWILLIFGTVSMVAGSLLALVQNTLKRLLAYSSISQMGFIAVSIGTGTALGLTGGVLHIINHAFIKALLFLCAAFIVYKAKTDNIYEISGNFKFRPIVTYSFLIGSLGLVGMPFFNGFISKWLIYVATLEVFPTITVLALITSVITLAYMLKAFYLIFLGNTKPTAEEARVHRTMAIPMIILSVMIILMGILPDYSIQVAEIMVSSLERVAYIGGVFS